MGLDVFQVGLGVAAGSVQAGGDAAKGQELAEECATCHGDDGKGDDETPALAGMDEAAHVAALKGFASGEREDESGMMADYAAALSACYTAGMHAMVGCVSAVQPPCGWS